jgi:hypothetical protein
MHLLAMTYSHHGTIRLEEVAGALTAVAGAALFIGGMMPLGRRTGQLLGGVCLAIAGVLVVLALHFGS